MLTLTPFACAWLLPRLLGVGHLARLTNRKQLITVRKNRKKAVCLPKKFLARPRIGNVIVVNTKKFATKELFAISGAWKLPPRSSVANAWATLIWPRRLRIFGFYVPCRPRLV